MSLPKIQVPTFKVTLPSSKKRILMKSLTTKEFKLLLIAKEDSSQEQVFTTIHQVIHNCILDNDVKVAELPWFDLEYLFMQLISSSTAQRFIKVKYKCKTELIDGVKESICGNVIPAKFDMKQAEIKGEILPQLVLTVKTVDDSDINLIFCYPTYNDISNNIDSDSTQIIKSCLKKVVVGEMVLIAGQDYDEEEAEEMLLNLSADQLTQINDFLEAMPKIQGDYKIECSKCKTKHDITLIGIQDFFI